MRQKAQVGENVTLLPEWIGDKDAGVIVVMLDDDEEDLLYEVRNSSGQQFYLTEDQFEVVV